MSAREAGEGRGCLREHLASGDVATVERCSCGTVHLTLGALTLRLNPEALRHLSATLTEAAEALAERERCAALPPALLGKQLRGES